MSSEEQLIKRVHRNLPSQGRLLRVGIGDDAAVITPAKGLDWIVTTDSFLEGVHFLRNVHSPHSAGYKALARATSDIAAMGARARYFFLTLALPEECTGAWFDGFLRGMGQAARRFGLTLAGGDTTKFPSVLAAMTVIGEAKPGRAILRSGARPGDILFVSGRLGEAELGLRMIQKGLHKRGKYKKLLRKQSYPEPRLALGEWLADRQCATAMIDTSDGLSTDLGHICKASGVGARVFAEKLPLVKVPLEFQRLNLDPLELGINGGEDYELLFSVPKRLARSLPDTVAGVPIKAIGEITSQRKVLLVDARGRSSPLRPGGWEPFRQPRANRDKR
jgi:thiamine-monophosphate kinase